MNLVTAGRAAFIAGVTGIVCLIRSRRIVSLALLRLGLSSSRTVLA
jgi:hypothetical protein